MDLVSIITPTTASRAKFLPRLHSIVNSQDYPNLEHIIIDGDQSIGYKLNAACEASKGSIIIRFDTDDIYASDYISTCVKYLQDCDLTGLSSAYFSNGNRAWLYQYTGGQPYVMGSGSAFWKRTWQRNKYLHKSSGEDLLFCVKAGIIKPHNYITGFIAQIHNDNTASHNAVLSMKEVSMLHISAELLPVLRSVS